MDMSRKLLLLAAVPLFYAGATFAQSADQAPAGTETPEPPAATTPAPDTSDPTAGTSEGADTEDMSAEGTTDTESDMGTSSTAAADGSEILTEESESQVRADKLLGMKVVDMAGEEIGEVEDILLDKNGQVAGLVLVTGEVLGLGGKSVAVSWQDVASAEDAEAITLNLTEEQLAAAPEFRTKEDIEAEEQLEQDTQPAAGAGTGTATPTAPAPADQQ